MRVRSIDEMIVLNNNLQGIHQRILILPQATPYRDILHQATPNKGMPHSVPKPHLLGKKLVFLKDGMCPSLTLLLYLIALLRFL